MLLPSDTYKAVSEDNASDAYVYIGEVRMVLEGKKNDVWTMLDDIRNNYPAIQVQAFNMREKTYMDSELNRVNQMGVSCSLAIYMHRDIAEISVVQSEHK